MSEEEYPEDEQSMIEVTDIGIKRK